MIDKTPEDLDDLVEPYSIFIGDGVSGDEDGETEEAKSDESNK
uniref:Uncharacterized protein n=1 Tax=Acrobeloides nanus TaxID=290746 RepID=A0A914CUS0_9BILA